MSTNTLLVDIVKAKVTDPVQRTALLDLLAAESLELKISSQIGGGVVVAYDSCTSTPTFQLKNFTLGGGLKGSGTITSPVATSSIKAVTWSVDNTYSCEADPVSFFDLLQLASLDAASLVPTVSSLIGAGLPTFQNCKYELTKVGFEVSLRDGNKLTLDDISPAEVKQVGFTISR